MNFLGAGHRAMRCLLREPSNGWGPFNGEGAGTLFLSCLMDHSTEAI
jgi:hypothetical protein